MKPPCMLVTSDVLPAVRFMVARDLVEIHDLRPTVVASRMGLTPAAVSQYASGMRGGRLVNALQSSEETKRLLNRLVSELLKSRPNQRDIMVTVCELCRIVRKEHLLCQLCDMSAKIDGSEQCDMCSRPPRCF